MSDSVKKVFTVGDTDEFISSPSSTEARNVKGRNFPNGMRKPIGRSGGFWKDSRDYRNSSNQPRRTPRPTDVKVASETMSIGRKNYYLDLISQNDQRFIRMAQVIGAHRNRVMFTIEASRSILQFLEHSFTVIEKIDENVAVERDILCKDKIKEIPVVTFVELRQNNKAIFLWLMQKNVHWQSRRMLNIPSQLLKDFHVKLARLLSVHDESVPKEENAVENGSIDAEPTKSVPDSTSLRIGNTIYYFDIGESRHGNFLSVSKVQPKMRFRTRVVFPASDIDQICSTLSKFAVVRPEKSEAAGDNAA